MSTISVQAHKLPRDETPFADVGGARDFAEQLMAQAQSEFELKGKQPTQLVFLNATEVHIVDVPISTKENERIAVGNMTIKLTHDLRAVGVATVSEAWLIPGATEAEAENPAALLQRDDKKEVLLVRASWDDQNTGEPTTAAKALLIVRDKGRSPALVERPDLFTSEGVDGILLLKKQGEGAIGMQAFQRPIMI